VILGAGVAASLLVREPLGPQASLQSMLIAVLCAAAAFGARYGFAAGVLAAVLLNDIIAPSHGAADLRSSGRGPEPGDLRRHRRSVGALADRLQPQTERARRAGHRQPGDFHHDDEAVIHRTLFDSLAKLAERSWVETSDDSGAILLASAAAGAPAAGGHPAAAGESGGWRHRPLASDGRTVGAVRWRYLGLETDVEIADEIAASLIDLGGSAIVRARLSIEKSEMEFVARSEHLRTILLDAVSHHFARRWPAYWARSPAS